MGVSAGSQLGPYLVEDRIVSSGSGEWFAASDASLERPVSVLVAPVPADEQSASTLRDRARRLAGVTDARLLPVYGQGEEGAQLWLATRRMSGQSLDGVDRLERPRAARIGVQIADQLAAMQDAGVAPDEISPADIVLEGADGGERAWLLPNPLRPQGPDASGASRSLVRLLDERTGEPLLADPQLEPTALVAQLAPFGVERSRRPLLVGGAVALLAIAAAILAVVLVRGSSSSGDAKAPVASEAVRIPLNARVAALIAGGRDVWAMTSDGTLVHVDPETDSVVGAPTKLFPKDAYVDMRVEGDTLWVGGPRLLVRLDSSTGRVLQRTKLGNEMVSGLLPSSGRLWATVSVGSDPRVHLVSYASDGQRTVGPGGPFGVYSVPVLEKNGTVWAISGSGALTRVARSGAVETIAFGSQAGFPVTDDGRVWAPTRIDRTVVPIDPDRMSLARAINLDGEPADTAAAAGSVWVLTKNPSLVYRIDTKTAKLLGSPVPAPDGASFIRSGAGSLWVDDPKTNALVRLTPTDPPPGASRVDTANDTLKNGPVPANMRLHYTGAGPHFSVQVPDDGWVAEAFDAALPQFELVRQEGSGLSMAVTNQIFDQSGRLAPVRTPADFLDALRKRDDVRIRRVENVDLNGVRGLRVTFAAIPKPPFPKLCERSPCAVLFPITRGTFVLPQGNEEFTMVKSGRQVLIVDASLGAKVDARLQARMNTLIDSIRFEP